MLPSISNLLINSPYSSKQSDPPTLNLSPASPVLSISSSPTQPSFLALDISPVLSPIASPSSSPYLNGIRYLSINKNNNDPPLEGDDPPQRLRLPSPSLQPISSPSSPVSPKSLFSPHNSTWNTTSPTKPRIEHSRSPSCSSTTSSVISFDGGASCASSESFSSTTTTTTTKKLNDTTTPPPVPNTQIVFDASGQPILKRRRGRPPTCNTNFEGGGWTFLTPTVWDIHISEERKERELKADQEIAKTRLQQQQQQNPMVEDQIMNDSMNAFTDSNMDTLLQMPKKKRGRKPKTHIAGNSCFVWKDLTSTRSSNKK